MRNKNFINIISLFLIVINLITCIVFYFVKYKTLDTTEKFSLSKDWILLVLIFITLAIVVFILLRKLKALKASGDIAYQTKALNGSIYILFQAALFIASAFATYAFYSGYSLGLLTFIFILAAIFSSISLILMIPSGIREGGISFYGYICTWSSVKAFKINDKGNFVNIICKYSFLFIKFDRNLQFGLKKKDFKKVSEFLDLKINRKK